MFFEYKQIANQGGKCMRKRPVEYNYYNLIFSKEKQLLLVSYTLQKGCTHRENYLKAISILEKKTKKRKWETTFNR